jgi:hypothetical protein
MDGFRWTNLRPSTVTLATSCMGVLCKKARDRSLILFALVAALVAFGAVGTAEEIGQTTAADDLPPEFKILWATTPDGSRRSAKFCGTGLNR